MTQGINLVRPALLMGALGCMLWTGAAWGQVTPMFGGTLIEGYDFAKDRGPKGSLAFNKDKGEFHGSYTGLQMPPGRRAVFAWLHDTVNQRTRYVGPVGLLKTDTGGKNKGRFVVKVPAEFRGGSFGTFEILAFSAETTEFIDGQGVKQTPSEPSGSKMQPALKPAFYLFGALPGAKTVLRYCGHGQDFTYAAAPDKQTCYD
ncbi:MAG: hypothetical protein HY342_09615 [Candidatus Lambdaproteobacteria bacterium]|nr:hypothetical protein [Candidatus Lambdaproteobacteria bacterium]